MQNARHRDLPSCPADSHQSIHKQRFPVALRATFGKFPASAARAAAVSFFLLTAGLPSVSAAGQQFFCTFVNSPTTECGFSEESKVPGRATIVPIGRNGSTSVKLHTEAGDNNVTNSGLAERDDLALSLAATNGVEGQDQWWAHSVLFPSDYVDPPETTCIVCTPDTWNFGVVFDFHQTGGTGPVPFEVDAMPVNAISPDRPTGLNFRGAGGDPSNPVGYSAPIGPVDRNVWYDFVYHIHWSSGSDGFIGAWVRKGDGPVYRRVLAHAGPTLLSGQGVYLKLANYHSAFGQASSVVHDRVIRGTTWQDVAIPGISLEGQYEENAASYSSNLTPSSWTKYESETGIFSGGAMLASNEVNATGTFTFTGTAVAWMGVKCNACGIATVSIDGGAPTTVDTVGVNASPNLTSEAVYYASGLALASHTLVITVSGTHSANSTNNYVAVDGFWVQPIASN